MTQATMAYKIALQFKEQALSQLKDRVERFLKAGSSFIGNVLEEGIVLYDNGTLTRIHQSLIKASRNPFLQRRFSLKMGG